MIRSAASKVMWVGRATVFLVGLAVILALVFGVATTALGATGANFILGKANTADAVSSLVTTITDTTKATQAALMVQQKSGGPALDLRVNSGKAPMKVNSGAKVARLNADRLDNLDSTEFVSGGGRIVSFVHTSSTSNIDSNCTYIDNAATNNNPNALIWATHVYTNGYHNSPLGVYFDTTNGRWCIFNENATGIATDTSFNVLVRP